MAIESIGVNLPSLILKQEAKKNTGSRIWQPVN